MRSRLLYSALIAAATATAVIAGPATAATAATAPESILALTISHGEQPVPADRTAVLSCDPAGGTHPEAGWACAEIAMTGGDLTTLYVGPARPCPLIYDPVTVTAHGWWQGQEISYTATFGNKCMLNVETGPVFAF